MNWYSAEDDLKCSDCGRRLVFVAISINGKLLKAWMCDCQYRGEDSELVPDGLIADLVRAREFDEGSVVIDGSKL